jgi:hypothetical protein
MVLEVRTYRLKPGTADAFVDLMTREALPLLADAGITVLACGLSLDPDEEPQPDAYLIRAFASREDREAQEAGFYGSAAWRDGPRAAVLSHIVSFHTVVLDVADDAAAAFRGSSPGAAG